MLTLSKASSPGHAQPCRFREFALEQPNCSCDRQTQDEWRRCLAAVRDFTAPQARIAQKRTGNCLGLKVCRSGIANRQCNAGTRPIMRRRRRRNALLHHSYAISNYSGQERTAGRVLIDVETELSFKEFLNSRMAYVTISDSKWSPQIFENDSSSNRCTQMRRNSIGTSLRHRNKEIWGGRTRRNLTSAWPSPGTLDSGQQVEKTSRSGRRP